MNQIPSVQILRPLLLSKFPVTNPVTAKPQIATKFISSRNNNALQTIYNDNKPVYPPSTQPPCHFFSPNRYPSIYSPQSIYTRYERIESEIVDFLIIARSKREGREGGGVSWTMAQN